MTRGFEFRVALVGLLICALVPFRAGAQFFPYCDAPSRFRPYAATGPVPWMQWKMNEGSGTTLHDSGATANNATVSIGRWNTGGIGGTTAFDFGNLNGTSITGTVGDLAVPVGVTNLTFTGWIAFTKDIGSQYAVWSQWPVTAANDLFIFDFNVGSQFWDVGTGSAASASFAGSHGAFPGANSNWTFFAFSWCTNSATPPAGNQLEMTNLTSGAIGFLHTNTTRIFNVNATANMFFNQGEGSGNVKGWFWANDWRIYTNQLTSNQLAQLVASGPL